MTFSGTDWVSPLPPSGETSQATGDLKPPLRVSSYLRDGAQWIEALDGYFLSCTERLQRGEFHWTKLRKGSGHQIHECKDVNSVTSAWAPGKPASCPGCWCGISLRRFVDQKCLQCPLLKMPLFAFFLLVLPSWEYYLILTWNVNFLILSPMWWWVISFSHRRLSPSESVWLMESWRLCALCTHYCWVWFVC